MTQLYTTNLPALLPGDSLDHYLREVMKFPMLSAEEEYMLAKRWQEHTDMNAAHRLVTSHLRLVVKIAMGFRGYGLPVADLISEGGIGLMQAVKKFDPDKGFRLSTYAMWWIKAAIQEYVLKSWSLVKVGTSASQKRLFFNLKRLKQQLNAVEQGDLSPENVDAIARELDVSEDEVIAMDRRMTAVDPSLNSPMRSDEEGGAERIDFLEEPSDNQEIRLLESAETSHRMALFEQAMTTLTEREQSIVRARRLEEPPQTLDELSQTYDISKERVRQVENRAIEKIQSYIEQHSAA